MSCVCGSFQCTCQEKCTCMAKDCRCKRCNELRSERPHKSTFRSEEKISPTRGATALFTDLQISDNRSTTSVSFNYPDRNLLFPGRTSDGKSLSRAPEQSAKEICKEFSTHSSSDSPKARSPKRKLSTTKKDSSPSDVKRHSPCRSDQNDILPKNMGVCPPDTEVKAPSSKRSEEIDKSGPVDLSAKESKSQTSDSSTLQDTLLIHSLELSECACCSPKGSPESKNAAVIQKNIQQPIELKHTSSSSSDKDCTTDKQFLSAQVVNKSLRNRNSEFEAHEKGSNKSKSSEKKESTNWQSKSGNPSKSRQMSVASSGVSRSTSRSDISRGASAASARPTSDMRSTVQSATSNTSESSRQASSRQSPLVSIRPDPFDPLGILGISRCFEDMDIFDVIFQGAMDELTSEAANSSTDSDTSLEARNPLVENPESNILEANDSEISNRAGDSPENPELSIFEANDSDVSNRTGASPEYQVVPDID